MKKTYEETKINLMKLADVIATSGEQQQETPPGGGGQTGPGQI